MKKIVLISSIVLTLLVTLFSCQSNRKSNSSYDLSYTDEVEISGGLIRGYLNSSKDVEIYKGIPYARPPVGDLRWREPQDCTPWQGVKDTVEFAPMAYQKRSLRVKTFLYNALGRHNPKGDREDNAPMAEDCLYLNIWKPAQLEGKAPVLVFIHGGGLTTGSPFYESYDGESMAKHGIIQVNIAYRLGVFGYLATQELIEESPNHTTGNYGLLDQIKALQWIYDNIESFGGDRNNITIAGESAGSSSVSALCSSPLAKGLFQRAIGESSSVVIQTPPHTFRSMQKSLKTGDKIMQEFNVTTMDELRKIPASHLIDSKYVNDCMTVDGYALTEYPWQTYLKKNNNEKALLNGFNKEEAFVFTFFSKLNKNNYSDVLRLTFGDFTDEVTQIYPPLNRKEAKKQYNKIFTSFAFAYPHHTWSSILRESDTPVWEYYFTKDNGGIGSYHSGELIYAYGNVPDNDRNYNETDYNLEKTMQEYWINFIKTGNPNGPDLPQWDIFDEQKGNVMELGANISMTEDPYMEIYKVYDKYQSSLSN